VGPFHQDCRLHRGPLAELQTDLAERLAGHRADARRPDAQHLQRHGNLRLARGHVPDPLRIAPRQVDLIGLGPRLRQPLLGPGDLLGRRQGTRDGSLPKAGRQGHSVLILGFRQCRLHLGGQVVGHEVDLLVGFLRRAGMEEIEVVNVAAGCVGHQDHQRRILLVAAEQPFEPVAVHAVVVGRDIALGHAAHVMERIGRVDGDRPPVRLAHDQDRHRGIGWPGRLDEVLAALARVGLHLIDAAERVGPRCTRLHKPAPVEHVLRRLSGQARQLGRTQPVRRAAHAVDDALHDKGAVVLVLRLSGGGRLAADAAGRMRMHGGNQHVGRRNPDLLFDQAARLGTHARLGAQQIEGHQGELCLAVVEHEAPRVQFIVYVGRQRGDEIADNRPAQRRRNHAGRRASPKPGRRRGRAQRRSDQGTGNQREHRGFHGENLLKSAVVQGLAFDGADEAIRQRSSAPRLPFPAGRRASSPRPSAPSGWWPARSRNRPTRAVSA